MKPIEMTTHSAMNRWVTLYDDGLDRGLQVTEAVARANADAKVRQELDVMRRAIVKAEESP